MRAIQGRNAGESLLDGVRELVLAADFPAAEAGFHLGPHFLNRIEVRAIRRKIQHFHALCLQNFPDSFDMVRTHIVHHYDVACPEGWK